MWITPVDDSQSASCLCTADDRCCLGRQQTWRLCRPHQTYLRCGSGTHVKFQLVMFHTLWNTKCHYCVLYFSKCMVLSNLYVLYVRYRMAQKLWPANKSCYIWCYWHHNGKKLGVTFWATLYLQAVFSYFWYQRNLTVISSWVQLY